MNIRALPGRIAGTASECVVHYGNSLPQDRSKYRVARQEFVRFVGISDRRSIEVLAGKEKSNGDNLIRTKYFLYHKGYEVEELKSLEPAVFTLGNFFALGVITLKQAAEEIGVSERKCHEYVQGIFPLVFQTKRDLLNAFLLKIGKEQQDDLRKALLAIGSLRAVQEKPAITQAKHSQAALSPAPPAKENGALVKVAIVEALGKQVEAMLPLARYVASNSCSSEDRQSLRSQTHQGVFELSNILAALCSETSRKEAMQKTNP